MSGIQLNHGVGTLERAYQDRVLGVATNSGMLHLGSPAAIADADRGHEPQAFGVRRIILDLLIVRQSALKTGTFRP
ncbi:MAG TPA: hypothetical protein VJP82_09680, partial [Sphingomicrobium sp.]|nr:hypothetical protein [Sphingomicrobium sp.]